MSQRRLPQCAFLSTVIRMPTIPRFTLLVGLLLTTTCAQGQSGSSEQELQVGLAAYQSAEYAKAIGHLERAVQLNPGSVESHLALADAYSAKYVPNLETEGPDAEELDAANYRLICRAVEEYKAVVALDPSSTNALNRIGNSYFQLAKFSDAELYFRQALKVDPDSKEALYTLAILNWTRSYQFRMYRRSELHLKNEKPLITSNLCAKVRSENLKRVEEALTLLTRLSEISNFEEVPVWLSVLYRERADIQCGDLSAYKADLRSASDWLLVACTAKANEVEHAPNPWPPAPPPAPNACGK